MTTETTTYRNIDERYGENVTATIEDYIELNPEAIFTQDENGIYEVTETGKVQVAESI